MKRKLVLKAEKLRLLTAEGLDNVVGGTLLVTTCQKSLAIATYCGCTNSQAAICDVQGTKR